MTSTIGGFERERLIRIVLAVALVGRLGAVVLSAVRVNPYSQADAISFAVRAEAIATGPHQIAFRTRGVVLDAVTVSIPTTKDVFGAILAPLWWLPGPSLLYARLVIVAFGILAVYNVFVLATYFHSERAGLFATLPFLLFPSLVLSHGALLREAPVLAGITGATRYYIDPSGVRSYRSRAFIGSAWLGVAVILRIDNLPIYAVVLGFGLALWLASEIDRESTFVSTAILFGFGSVIYLHSFVNRIVQYLAGIKQHRAHGNTAYLTDVIPQSLLSAVAFCWIGVLYFYLAPFPWMLSTPEELVLIGESIGNLLYLMAGMFGGRYLYHRRPVVTTTLVFGFLIASVFYGLVEANVGAAVRHRQMFSWVFYVFGAVWISTQFRFGFSDEPNK